MQGNLLTVYFIVLWCGKKHQISRKISKAVCFPFAVTFGLSGKVITALKKGGTKENQHLGMFGMLIFTLLSAPSAPTPFESSPTAGIPWQLKGLYFFEKIKASSWKNPMENIQKKHDGTFTFQRVTTQMIKSKVEVFQKKKRLRDTAGLYCG